MLDVVAYIIGGVILVLAPSIQKWVKDKYRIAMKQMEKNRDAENQILKYVEIMQHRFGAMRVIVWSYYNGIKNVLGQPAEFLSITYEKTNENVTTISSDFQMIPTTLWKDAIADVEKQQGVLQIDIDTASDDMRFYMHKYHIERTYQIKINAHDIGQGLITIDFPSHNHSLDLRDIEFLTETCRSINDLMKKIK